MANIPLVAAPTDLLFMLFLWLFLRRIPLHPIQIFNRYQPQQDTAYLPTWYSGEGWGVQGV
jgi:hypothetical protein